MENVAREKWKIRSNSDNVWYDGRDRLEPVSSSEECLCAGNGMPVQMAYAEPAICERIHRINA